MIFANQSPKKFALSKSSQLLLGISLAKSSIESLLKKFPNNLFVLTDPLLYSLWTPLFTSLPKPIFIPSEERYKSWSSVQKITKQLLKNHCNRSSHLLIIGGGVLCDLGGFTAACYMRGISFSFIPTTLLSMVDAAIGGKTAINTPWGKNLIGSFSFPSSVTIDPSFLKTLPSTLISQGASEMFKHALLTDKTQIFSLQKLLLSPPSSNVNPAWLTHIELSCKTKIKFISSDFNETANQRIFLNLGHTLAHALESSTKYQSISHGDAVFWGLAFAAYLSTLFCGLSTNSYNLILEVISPFLCPWPTVSIEKICSAMLSDKKSLQENIRYVLLKEIAQPHLFPLKIKEIQLALSDFVVTIAKNR